MNKTGSLIVGILYKFITITMYNTLSISKASATNIYNINGISPRTQESIPSVSDISGIRKMTCNTVTKIRPIINVGLLNRFTTNIKIQFVT
jgi:hypothetical protein